MEEASKEQAGHADPGILIRPGQGICLSESQERANRRGAESKNGHIRPGLRRILPDKRQHSRGEPCKMRPEKAPGGPDESHTEEQDKGNVGRTDSEFAGAE